LGGATTNPTTNGRAATDDDGDGDAGGAGGLP
jgi:hypothetical protein